MSLHEVNGRDQYNDANGVRKIPMVCGLLSPGLLEGREMLGFVSDAKWQKYGVNGDGGKEERCSLYECYGCLSKVIWYITTYMNCVAMVIRKQAIVRVSKVFNLISHVHITGEDSTMSNCIASIPSSKLLTSF